MSHCFNQVHKVHLILPCMGNNPSLISKCLLPQFTMKNFSAIVSCISRVACLIVNVVFIAIEGPDTAVRDIWVVTERGTSVHIHRF